MLTHAQHAEDHFSPVLADQHDFYAALTHDEERIAGSFSKRMTLPLG
jgi:hypothetical protein